MTSPDTILTLLSRFAPVFSRPVWKKVQVLFTGTILARGPRRVSSALKAIGLFKNFNYSKYHRVLSRDQYSPLRLAKILFCLLLKLIPKGEPILIGTDESLERRKGRKIKAKGCYRDAVRSSKGKLVTSFGLKWECMALMIRLPFTSRRWALPFMTVLSPPEKVNQQQGKRHRATIDWTILMMKVVCRWIGKPWILLGDGAYACMNLAKHCVEKQVTLITRCRWDSQFYEFPKPEPPRRGRKRIKGDRIFLKKLLEDDAQDWKIIELNWYGGKKKTMKLLSHTALWYQSGKTPLPIRYVMIVDPDGEISPGILMSTKTELEPEKIVEYFVTRWNIEVTFEEVRAHLGFETQRQWSDKAIARTTPLLMGLFSLITIIACTFKDSPLFKVKSTEWYQKNDEATFSDVLAFVRRMIWSDKYFSNSDSKSDSVNIPFHDLELLIEQLVSSG